MNSDWIITIYCEGRLLPFVVVGVVLRSTLLFTYINMCWLGACFVFFVFGERK